MIHYISNKICPHPVTINDEPQSPHQHPPALGEQRCPSPAEGPEVPRPRGTGRRGCGSSRGCAGRAGAGARWEAAAGPARPRLLRRLLRRLPGCRSRNGRQGAAELGRRPRALSGARGRSRTRGAQLPSANRGTAGPGWGAKVGWGMNTRV